MTYCTFLTNKTSLSYFNDSEQGIQVMSIFSAPEPKAQVHYCDHALSVVCPSVVRPSLTFHIFDFSSETTERNSTKVDRKQDLNILYQVYAFRTDRKNKMAALASDWLRRFRLLLWNHWKEFNKTWQEARSQRPLPSLCFSGWSEKQDGRPGLWLAETFSTSPLKSLNGIQRNLTGSKISMSSTKFVFFGLIGKTGWPPWPLIGWDIFDFSSETAEQNSTKLDRKQDLNVLYQVCVFESISKQKCPPWPIPLKGGILYSGARYVALWASCFAYGIYKLLKSSPESFWASIKPLMHTEFLLFSTDLTVTVHGF